MSEEIFLQRVLDLYSDQIISLEAGLWAKRNGHSTYGSRTIGADIRVAAIAKIT
jgi:hypothetical protein